MSPSGRPKPARKSSNSHRSTLSLQRTEVIIHVYDLLPPGKISTMLWAIGSSLLHSGVVIGDREYAYGGHDRRGLTGVYWTKPGLEPPGGTFRQAVLHGFSFRPAEELNAIIHQVCDKHALGSRARLTDAGIRGVSGHVVQPPHQELQPLYLIPLREAHWAVCAELDQPCR
jgi:hypothetical protein